MAQGGKVKKSSNSNKDNKTDSKRRNKKIAPKSTAPRGAPKITGSHDNEEVAQMIQKKVRDHQKKIYKSIEQSIIDNAIRNRERFELLKK